MRLKHSIQKTHMFETIIPRSLHNFACVRLNLHLWASFIPIGENRSDPNLIFLDSGVLYETDIIMYVEVEKRPRFPSCFVYYEVVKSVMLAKYQLLALRRVTYMWYD